MNKSGYRFTTVVLSSILLLLSSAYLYLVWAVETKSWDFATASDYTVYKGDGTEDTSNTDIIIESGVAKLVSRTTQINDDTQAEYDTGAYSSTSPQGQDVSLMLAKSGSTYSTSGTFTSRVFSGAAGNTWQRLSASLQSRVNMTGLNWTRVAGNSSYYNAVIYWIYTGWSDDGPGMPCVIKDGTGYKAYWTDSIYRVNTRLGGPATSDDGITFTKVQDVCLGLGAAGKFDNTYIQSPCVIKDDTESDPAKRYKMWYGGYATIGVGAWRIGYATSADGITWTRQTGPNTGGSVIDIGIAGDADSTGVYFPWVIKDGSTYKMWYMGTNGIGYHLMYTFSTDGVNWCDEYGASNKRLAMYSGENRFDLYQHYYPCVIKDGSLYKMWYTGYAAGASSNATLSSFYQRIGYAVSYDGINWTTINGALTSGCVLDRSTSGSWFDTNWAAMPCVIKEEDGSYKMWFGGYGPTNNRRIGLATSAVDTAASTAVRFQVRSGASANLTGDFVGPDGTTSSYYIIDNALPPPHGQGYNTLYWNTDSVYFPKSAALINVPGKFSVTDQYVQYRAYFDGAADGSLTPTVDWVAFEGTGATGLDNTLGDFNKGTLTDVTTTYSADGQEPYIGLAKQSNGLYHPSGTYTSAVFDGGADADWDSVSWSGGSQAISPPEPGLVGLYHLDGNADDSSGRGNHGTASGTVSYDTTVKKSGSACFIGNGNGYISLPATLNEFKAMTVSAWVFYNSTDTSPGGLVVSSYQTPTYDSFYLSAYPYYVSAVIKDLGNTSQRSNTIYSTPTPFGEWHHVAFTWDGTPNVNSLKIYIDGREQISKSYDSSSIVFRCIRNFTSIPIHIGHYYVSSAPATHYYFKGKIDEVAIYDRALSSDEIDLQYKRAADIKFQCRSGDANPPTGNFVGPDGTIASYYTTSGGSALGGEIPNNRYFQYRAYFEGAGANTPALKDVTVSYNSASFTDDTRTEFDLGSYDNSTTRWYGDQISLTCKPQPFPLAIDSSETGLLALLHIDGNWNDSSGNGNHATAPTNVPYFTTFAKVGTQAGAFFGAHYATLPNLDLPGSSTIEFWANDSYTFSVSQSFELYSDYNSVTAKAQHRIYTTSSNQQIRFTQYHTDGSALTLATVPRNRGFDTVWHHIAVVRDDAAKTVVLYVDGKPEKADSYAGKEVVSGATAGNETIGRLGDTTQNYAYMIMDELAVYDRALTPEEIARHAGIGYPLHGTNTFTSRTMDAGLSVTWNDILWKEKVPGYGNELSAESTQRELTSEAPGIKGLWHMNNVWDDSSGSGRNGLAQGDATFDAAGKKIGSACGTFDGTGDYVQASLINLGDIKTIEFWVNVTTNTRPIIEILNDMVYISSDSSNRIIATGFTSPVIYINGNIHAGNYLNAGWNHVAVVTNTPVDKGTMYIGGYNPPNHTNLFIGKIDEVAVYNRALTYSEIKGHYLSQCGDYGLIALWHMDNDWTDATGHGHDGTATGAAFSSTAKFGTYSGSFNGTDSYLSFPDTDFPSRFAQRTFEAWIKTTSTASQCIFHYGTPHLTQYYEFMLYLDNPGTASNSNLTANFHNGYNGNSKITDVQALNDGSWHHVAVTIYKYVYDNNYMYFSLFVDGELKSTGSSSNPIPNTILSGTGRIGMTLGNAMPFNGLIDEAAIYSRTLTADEIREHYIRGISDLKTQVSLDGGSTWTDQNGNAGEYITETPATLQLGGTSRYIKYKTIFSTGDYLYSPVIYGVDVSKATYTTDNPFVIPNAGQEYLGYLTSFAQTPGSNNLGTIKYQISKDDGSTWYWWNGSEWAQTSQGYAASSTASAINTNIDSFYEQAGSGTLNFKAFLHSDGIQPVELDNVSLGYAPGKITVTAPNGGENLLSGGYGNITWTAAGTIASDTWDLAYSTDAGSSWTPIASGETVNAVEGVYTYNWSSIPNVQSSTARVKVTNAAEGSIKDTSNANFTIGLGFQVTAPNGGETWYVGSSGNNIQWKSSSGMGTTVKLYYTLNGTDYTSITTSTPNQYSDANTYAWTIGSSASDDGLYSETVKIKVTNQSGQNEDASDAVFTLAGMKLIQPNGGEQIKRGGTYEIQWKSAGAGSTVTLEYTTDGSNWDTITATESNTSGLDSYEWTIPDDAELSANSKVRVTSNSDGNLTDVSDASFTIADLVITSPNGSEVWQCGSSSNPITWTFVGDEGDGKVTVSYSTDSGSTWTVYNNNVDNQAGSNSYSWTVPFAPSDNVRVKVSDNTAGSTMSDTSNSSFSIAGVKITLPNGSETYGIDSANFIRWSANNASDTGALYYSVDGGATWSSSPIVGAEEVLLSQGTTGFSWTPSNDPGTVPTVQARVKMVALTPASDANPPVPLATPMEDSSDANFTIRGLRVTAPALNASWLLGSSHDIQWTSAGTSAATATLYYSVIGDFSDQVVITAPPVTNNEVYPGNNSYTWDISTSVTPSSTAKVKVVAGAYNALSPAFTLKGIKVTAPASGATVTQNVASSVTWSSAGIDGNVNIYYSSDNGSTYSETPINVSPVNVTTGTYSWTPNTAILTPSTSAKLKIQVVSGSDTGLYAESAQFTLKGIKISAPVAGTTWELGQTQSITWTAAGAGSTCNIYYAADGTNFTSTVNSSPVLLSAGTYSWTIPATITPSNGVAKIRITSDTNVSSSSGAFTIKGIKVTNPTATTIWEVGESVTISHAVVGAMSALNVYYVKDGVETQIGTTMPNSSFPWVVAADAEGPGIIIRLKSFMPNYTGDSPAFQIVGEASLAVSEPSAASSWKVSETNTITWTRSGSTERTFTVEYDDNLAFASPTPISGTPAYDGAGLYSLDWSVPDNVGACYIKVTDTGNSNITDISEAFKIIPKFRVNIPNGGETLYALKPGTTVNWGTTGSAGTVDLYYSTDTPLYETWTKINSTAIPDNGTGTIERITSYSWTVPNIQSTVVKIKVQASSAGLSEAYDLSDDVFTIKYYKVTWNVKSATTGDHLDKLFVIDSSGWSEADLTSPIDHYYPYGDSYNTNWSRADYFDKAERGWETDEDNKVINITMSESSLAPEYHVMSNFSYNASQDKFLINSWVERGGVILAKPSSCIVHIYDASGGPIQELTTTTYDANGVFWQEWPTTNLDQNAMYFAKVDILYSGETYSSGLSYSLNIPKAIAGLGTTVAQQLTDLQTAIGTDLATQTTAIGTKIDTLETSIGTNLDAKISTVKTDIAAVKTVVDSIEDAVGAIGGDLATPISEAVAEDLAAQLAKGIQAEILTRPTSAGFGTATDIRFRTTTGMSPTITVYDANNVTRIASAAMVEVGTTGIYEYALTPQSAWGAGEYTVVCEEPTKNAVDSMVLSVSESVGAGAGTDEGMVNSINATVTTIDSNVKTMLSKVNTLPDDTTDVNTSVSSLLATVGKTTDAAGTNSLFGKIASAQGDITAFKADITSYVDGVETTLGTTADAAGTSTVYGKIRSLEQTLSALGPDGAKANKELLAAKDQAAAASRAAEDIKKMIAAGGKNAEAYGALQRLAGDLAKLQSANAKIGGSVTADSITDFIRETRAKLAQVAMKEGYENLVPETGEVGQVNLTEEEDVEDLRNNMTELKALLSQVRSLLDKQVNAPVVKSWIEGK